MSVDDVIAEVERYNCPLVEVTGGEPLLQPDVYPLMDRLLAAGKTVMLETGGHRSVEAVPAAVVKVMDVKCPGSGESGHVDWDNLHRLTRADQVKFVIKDRADYEYARDVVRRESLADRVDAVLFSPVHAVLEARPLAEWILADGLPVRLQLQAHKYIWPPDTRGV
jgi:7-carboxy-7-deazaguanine synthase